MTEKVYDIGGNFRLEASMQFMAHVVTEIDFVDGDDVSDGVVENYAKHLAEELQKAARDLSLRTIKGTSVTAIQVAEIKSSL
jgi:aspartyl/asparaginyl-tRNA synthetase